MSAIARKSAAPVKASAFDVETDVVVVGGGAGGLATALFSRWQGNEVVLIEKADELGGTTKKAAFWYWVRTTGTCRNRHRGPQGGLHPLHGAAVAPGSLRPRRCALRHEPVGI